MTNCDSRLCRPISNHSRIPGTPSLPAAGRTRNDNVSAPPSASRTGASIDSIMCPVMCTLNTAVEYRPMPDDVLISSVRQPRTQATVRPTGHASPRSRSRRTPIRYTTAITIAAVPKIRSKRQSKAIRANVGGPLRSYPSAASVGVRFGSISAGGGVRPRPTARPTVAARTSTSAPANRSSGPRAVGSAISAGRARRRCIQPNPPSTINARILPTISRPYVVVNRSARDTRTRALMTPLMPMTTKQTPAIVENRRAATSVCAPRLRTCASSANSPPAHNDAAPRCRISELVAMSCDPPAEE
ncbi:unannotated protein [freshwater metagenome]|uniref:Unannotated protein n=1 Tax=freshwater metagenome TaxID=449393 RepID=A0A6J7FFH2_9ZZZZ